MKKNSFSPLEDLKIPDMLFTSHNTPHITLDNEQCLKLLLGVCNTKEGAIYLQFISAWSHDRILDFV
jgi:hypothetical protein